MPSNADLKDLNLMTFDVFVNDRSIGFIADKDVEFNIDSNVVTATAQLTGKATIKAFSGGNVATVKFTVNSKNKDILRTIYNQVLTSSTTSTIDGSMGNLEISSSVGRAVRPVVLTLYPVYFDADLQIKYGTDAINPYSIQLYKAIAPQAINWKFKSSEIATHDLEFEGMPDFDLPNYAIGLIGNVNRPYVGLHIVNTGIGYSSVPTITFGTAFVASATAILGDTITSGGRAYKVSIGGVMSATAPSHTTGSVANGAAQLDFLGTHSTFTLAVAGGKLVPELTTRLTIGTIILPATITGVGTGAIARLVPLQSIV